MPISACVATEEVMAAWATGQGEAIHTSTFLGHPVTSAAALASLDTMIQMDVCSLARAFESKVRARFGERVQGRGAMLGVRVEDAQIAGAITGKMLEQGYIILPNGVQGDILALTPPLALTEEQTEGALDVMAALLAEHGS